jgi:putative ABC transport system permease protein
VGGVRRRLRMALVVSEIAVASLLLVAAGLALRSFTTLLNVPAGFTAEDRLTLPVALRNPRYRGDEAVLGAYDQIERRFAAIPGVRRVGATGHVPLSGQDQRRGIAIEGGSPQRDAPTRAHPRGVTPGYMEAMGLQLVAGRGFTDADRADSPRVAIVNETMARRYWPGASPIGRRVAFAYIDTPQWREVVGVVRDVKHWGLAAAVNPEMYMPVTQYTMAGLTFVLETDRAPADLAGPLRDALRAVDPNLPLAPLRTMDDVAARSVALQRGVMVLLAAFGATALMLAAAGSYGVMAHFVGLRTGEIGVRLALGAKSGAVLRGILAEGLVHAAAGLAIGLLGAVAVVRVFRGLLYGVQPSDPLTLVAVAAVMFTAAFAACLVPALRAMRIDPVVALRQ